MMSSNARDNANLILTLACTIMVGVGGYMAKQVLETSIETRRLVAVIEANQSNDRTEAAAIKATVVNVQAEIKATVASVQADIAALRAKIQANEIEIIKLKVKAQ